jgi:dihydropyrimidinase
MTRTLVAGGTVVSSTGAGVLDVLVDGEQVAALVSPGSTALGADLRISVDRVIDATGKLVVPGGVDVHTHMELPFGGTFASDTFETGTRAAAWGGTTTIVDFAVQSKGERIEDGLAAWFAKAERNCAIDYGFHMIVTDVNDQSLVAMDSLVDDGITSFKLFMAYPGVLYSDDGQILRAMQRAAANGAMVMMHAENGIAIDVLVEQALERGETDPIHHGLTRPAALEAEATNRAIRLAEVAGAPLYIVHLSASEALAAVVAARDTGANVFAETCPQYLYLNLEDHLGAPGFAGAAYVCSTPLRSKHEDHRSDLWRALRTNDLSVVSTDHCPFCMKEQKELGVGDFSKIPNGIGGIEHRMDLMYQGVVTGEISPSRWVELCATTPARMFGLYPRKGVLAPGADADLVVYDPNARTRISATTHHMNMDHSAFEGFEIDGGVELVMSRGRVVIEGGAYHGAAGHGQYLRRGLSHYLV